MEGGGASGPVRQGLRGGYRDMVEGWGGTAVIGPSDRVMISLLFSVHLTCIGVLIIMAFSGQREGTQEQLSELAKVAANR